MNSTIEKLSTEVAELAAETIEIEQRTAVLAHISRKDMTRYTELRTAYNVKFGQLVDAIEADLKPKPFWKNLFRKN